MIVIVDSSVAIKWFLAEPDHARAVALSKAAEQIHAPELLIAEVTNVAWKESIRKKITPEQAGAIAAQIGRSPVRFVPISTLHERALRIALEINHSVYDCLYLACAEQFGANLITADRRLVNKTKTHTYANFVKFLDDPMIESGALSIPLHLSRGKLDEIIEVVRLFQATSRNVDERLREGRSGEFRFVDARDSAIAFQSPSHRRLEKIYGSLSRNEQIDFLALGWLGQGYSGSDWIEIRRRAESYVSDDHARYILSLAIYLSKGLEAIDAGQ